MNVKIIVGETSEQDVVVLANGARYQWSAWLKMTELSVKSVRAAFDANAVTRDAIAGRNWLHSCGVNSRADFEDLEKHLPQLRQPMSGQNARRCVVCGSRIWGKESLLTGVGSGCRRDNHATKTMRAMRRQYRIAPVGV